MHHLWIPSFLSYTLNLFLSLHEESLACSVHKHMRSRSPWCVTLSSSVVRLCARVCACLCVSDWLCIYAPLFIVFCPFVFLPPSLCPRGSTESLVMTRAVSHLALIQLRDLKSDALAVMFAFTSLGVARALRPVTLWWCHKISKNIMGRIINNHGLSRRRCACIYIKGVSPKIYHQW